MRHRRSLDYPATRGPGIADTPTSQATAVEGGHGRDGKPGSTAPAAETGRRGFGARGNHVALQGTAGRSGKVNLSWDAAAARIIQAADSEKKRRSPAIQARGERGNPGGSPRGKEGTDIPATNDPKGFIPRDKGSTNGPSRPPGPDPLESGRPSDPNLGSGRRPARDLRPSPRTRSKC